jgi:hypothetical protein
MKGIRHIASALLIQGTLIATAMLSLSTVIGFCGSIYWFFDLFSYYRPQYMIVLLASGVVLFGFRKWREGCAAFFFGMVNLLMILPLYWPVAEPGASAPHHRALLSNLQYSSREYELVYEFIHHIEPVFILFVEVTGDWTEALKELHDYPFSVVEPREGCIGIALFSRIPKKTLKYSPLVKAPPQILSLR